MRQSGRTFSEPTSLRPQVVTAMAQVKIEDVVYMWDGEFKKALADTMAEFAPHATYNREALFKYFLRRVYTHCSVWEEVPDGDCGFGDCYRPQAL